MAETFQTAWRKQPELLLQLISAFERADILEYGGGRSPTFALSDLPETVGSYTVNDISASELEKAPPGYDTACFDVCGDTSQFAGRFDVIFSKMLAEHVPDGEAMHRNTLALLKPGGVAFHFMPKLYALPFVANYLLPERLSQTILYAAFPHRRSESPKFPAVYSWCHGHTGRLAERIKALGYSDVEITPFYGHGYYRRLPGIKQAEVSFRRLAMRADWSFWASYMYVIAHK